MATYDMEELAARLSVETHVRVGEIKEIADSLLNVKAIRDLLRGRVC